jgi:drug/metabolite transporter (DMT)-like permease
MYAFSVVTYLALRVLQKKGVPSSVNNFYMWAFSAFTFIAIAVFQRRNIELQIEYILFLLATAFFLSYLGQIFSLEGIRKATNPGYSLMIQKSYAIYTAVASVFLFNSELTLKNVFAIIIVIMFLVLIIKSDKTESKNKESNGWIRDSFISFFAFGTNALAAKWLLDQGVDPFVRGYYVLIFLWLLFSFDLFRKVRINKTLLKYVKNKSYYFWFILMGITTGLFNLTMQYAYEYTPNVGYVNIINTASIGAITVLSAILFREKLGMNKLIGVLGVTAGIILLII